MFRVHGDGGWAISIHFLPDGIHWSDVVARSGACGDRTTVFYNPFRKVWVYSIRANASGLGRSRRYWENPNVLTGAKWESGKPTFWVGADRLDPRRSDLDIQLQQGMENPDGMPITIDIDLLGKPRNKGNPKVGPFSELREGRNTFEVFSIADESRRIRQRLAGTIPGNCGQFCILGDL